MSSLFGTDGIRGRSNEPPLTPENVLRLGQCLAEKLPMGGDRPRVVVGRDTRRSGPMLQSALVAGLTGAGVDVDDVGVVPTPAVAEYTKISGADAGVMISASHNPAEDNGLKFFGGDGFKFDDSLEAAISETFVSTVACDLVDAGSVGRVRDMHAAVHAGFVASHLKFAGSLSLHGMTVAVDCANGAASRTTPETLEKLGANLVLRHADPDGDNINDRCGSTFPNEIARLVTESGAVAGITHDGDADRVLLADEAGRVLDGDEIMAIVAQNLSRRGVLRGNAIVATVMSNLGLEETLTPLGINIHRCGVGDRQVLEMLRQKDLAFGGEQSGHFIFLDYATTGDGLMAALAVLRILRETGRPLSELSRFLVRYPQVQSAVKVVTKPPLEMVPPLTAAIRRAENELGARGRVLVRYSGTESKLRILVEGPSEERIRTLVDELSDVAAKALGG